MKQYFLYSILSGLLLSACSTQPAEIHFKYIDPLQKVFPESNYFDSEKAHADVARGEHATFQFVVRSNANISDLSISVEPPINGNSTLSNIKKGFVGFVKDSRTNSDPAKDNHTSVSGFYPDPITYDESKDVVFGTTQPIWITIEIPTDSEPGVYTGEVEISGNANGKRFTESKIITIEVYKPIIDHTSLWTTNWFYLDKLSQLNNDEPVEMHSELFWKLVRKMARTMAEYRQNVAKISPYDHTDFTYDGNNWSFNFTNYNKMVEIFVEEGVIGRLEGGHLGKRLVPGWSNPYGLYVPTIVNDSINKEVQPLEDPKTKEFYSQFLPTFMQNLQDHGWDKIYMQHIADEPNSGNMDSYIEVTDYITGILPDLKVIEATHEYRLEEQIDVWVPHLATLKHRIDFYTDRLSKGDEVWFYTCHSPKGEFANRFVRLPLIKTRLLHWINFKYDVTGYLHWGYNFWGKGGNITFADDPFEEASGIAFRSGFAISGGDGWIAYPGYKTIYPSIRLEAMRDGIVDYELLKMLEEKYPEKAKDIVGRVVFDFDNYDTNIDLFRQKRRDILKMLSY